MKYKQQLCTYEDFVFFKRATVTELRETPCIRTTLHTLPIRTILGGIVVIFHSVLFVIFVLIFISINEIKLQPYSC